MENGPDASAFLRARRDRLTPERAGLPLWGGNRRVPGLRREEVAMLAGISTDYYVRLERGDLRGASDQILWSLGRALQLDEAEQEHLFDLARAANAGTVPPRAPKVATVVRPSVLRLIDSFTGVPAMVRSDRREILATNALGAALYAPVVASPYARLRPDDPADLALFTFLDPAAKTYFPEWDDAAAALAGSMRQEAAKRPGDPVWRELIGELATRSPEFARLWGQQNVRFHRQGAKAIEHPIVGRLELDYETLVLPGDAGQSIITYSAPDGSDSAAKLLALEAVSLTA